LSERALSDSWSYFRDFKAADVVLVSLDSAEGEDFWANHLSEYPAVCFVACSSQTDFDSPWKLNLSANLLPSRKELVELLNALSRHIAERAEAVVDGRPLPPPVASAPPDGSEDWSVASPAGPAEDAARGETEAETVPSPAKATPRPGAELARQPGFDPSLHFLGLLQKAIAADEDAIFVLPNHVWLAVSPQNRRYYSIVPADSLQPLFLADPGDIQVRNVLMEKVLESPMGKEMNSHPLAELVWHAVLAASGGRLLAGCQPVDIVRLKHWPEIAHLPGYRKFLRIAAFMNHNAASLESIAEHTGAPIGQVFDFHNACEAMGLLERHAQPDMVKKSSAGMVKDLYRKISSRLARNGNADDDAR